MINNRTLLLYIALERYARTLELLDEAELAQARSRYKKSV